jgi:uncharacterized membrane protein YfcA
MFELLAIFLLTGAVAGMLAGLFGVGGGLIMVPALAWILPLQGYTDSVVMQVSIGTSLAVIAITSLSSTLAHHRRGGVLWPVLARFAPGLVAGALAGAFIADQLTGHTLKTIVGTGALLVSIQMLLNLTPKVPREKIVPGSIELAAAGGAIGLLSSLIGIGGGSLTVPYMALRGITMREAVGTAAACGIPIAWAGTLGFMLTGPQQVTLPGWNIGYVSLTAFFGIAFASAATAPLGAKLAHKLPPLMLKRLFALLLALIGLKMLLT